MPLDSSPFDPSSIPGLTLWLRSDDIAQADNTAVSSWANKMDAANPFTQGTGGSQPTYQTNEINGHAAVRFDGVGDCLGGPVLSNFITVSAKTVFIVFEAAAINHNDVNPSANDTILVDSASDESAGGFWGVSLNTTAGAEGTHFNYDGSYDVAEAPYTSGNWARWEGRHDTGTIYSKTNNGTEFSAASGNTTSVANNLWVGGWPLGFSEFQGDIAEILIYNVVVSAGNRTSIDGYLYRKYFGDGGAGFFAEGPGPSLYSPQREDRGLDWL